MTHIISLRIFPTMAAAYDATIKLYDLFKKTHKRAEKVDLFIGSSGDPKGVQVHEVRCHFTREHEVEARWFVEAVKTI